MLQNFVSFINKEHRIPLNIDIPFFNTPKPTFVEKWIKDGKRCDIFILNNGIHQANFTDGSKIFALEKNNICVYRSKEGETRNIDVQSTGVEI